MQKTITKSCRRRIIVACTAIKSFHEHKMSNCISRRVNRMEIGTSTADTMVFTLMVFKLIESAFKYLFVTYRNVLGVNALQLDDMKLVFSRDVKNVLRREVVKRKGIKWSLGLKVIMHKSVDPAVVIDPPAVFNTDKVVGLIGSNYHDN